jgi:hypothetical protein
MSSAPKSVQATFDLKLFRITGTWEPDTAEQQAAWELYVELVTRVGVVQLRDGLTREALTSLYLMFGKTRDILTKYGPAIAMPKRANGITFGYLAIGMLNNVLRPFLSYWHPELSDWEARRPDNVSAKEYERGWERDLELRQHLDRLANELRQFVIVLAEACSVPAAIQLPGGSA